MVIFIMLSFSLRVSLELLCVSRSARPGLWSFHLVSFSFQVSQGGRVNISISEAFSAGYLPIYGHFMIILSFSLQCFSRWSRRVSRDQLQLRIMGHFILVSFSSQMSQGYRCYISISNISSSPDHGLFILIKSCSLQMSCDSVVPSDRGHFIYQSRFSVFLFTKFSSEIFLSSFSAFFWNKNLFSFFSSVYELRFDPKNV